MPDRLVLVHLERDALAAQPGVHAFPLDPAPDAAPLGLGGGIEFRRGINAVGPQPGLHARADAEEILQFQTEQALGPIGIPDDHESP